jgi:hypothetical protein
MRLPAITEAERLKAFKSLWSGKELIPQQLINRCLAPRLGINRLHNHGAIGRWAPVLAGHGFAGEVAGDDD